MRLSQFWRGIMQDVAEEMMDRFSTCAEQRLWGTAPQKERSRRPKPTLRSRKLSLPR
jgi:hypothetical protein